MISVEIPTNSDLDMHNKPKVVKEAANKICLLTYDEYHKFGKNPYPKERVVGSGPDLVEQSAQYWIDEAQASIKARQTRLRDANGSARNVVMFLGDGMSVPTLSAARTLMGQRDNRPGEESQLAFEAFPTVGLAKTYCVNAQIADSACTASAYLCGVKANRGTIGVTAAVPRFDCVAAEEDHHQLSSIAAWALQDGRDAGIVTTTRVTHASPAGAYAHTAARDWESDTDARADCGVGTVQRDIAHQLVHSYPGHQFKARQ
ncbi:unnamed protein product [Parnassius apollo]|uniref:(apollo) hypothetical protein n=1 Tax=Parnassius apollo TaxID=110799 RepID=A0A8S3WPD0_PARAO|nr:unnamed protein product [Parnassius apollo]